MPKSESSWEPVPSHAREWAEHIKALPALWVRTSSVGLMAFIGLTDYLTGSHMSFSIFYLLPISIATLGGRRRDGLVLSVVGGVVWGVADIAGGAVYPSWWYPIWNALVRVGYFVLHTILLAMLLVRIDEEKALARLDPLTGAANWRHFEEYATREILRARRSRRALTLAYLDLDNFKSVNDALGHDAGDELLRRVARGIQNEIRPADILARVGGDEFVILMPETDYVGAGQALGRVRARAQVEMGETGCPVSASIGAVTFDQIPSSLEVMVKRVDDLMYTVKRAGKNALRQERWPAEMVATQKA